MRMLTELVEYGSKMEEKVKAMKSEIKKNKQGANSDGKESRIQIYGLDQKEKNKHSNKIERNKNSKN